MKLDLKKLEELDVLFSNEAVSEEQHLKFSAFLQKRKLQMLLRTHSPTSTVHLLGSKRRARHEIAEFKLVCRGLAGF